MNSVFFELNRIRRSCLMSVSENYFLRELRNDFINSDSLKFVFVYLWDSINLKKKN